MKIESANCSDLFKRLDEIDGELEDIWKNIYIKITREMVIELNNFRKECNKYE